MDQAQLARLSAELDRLLDLPAGQRGPAVAEIDDAKLRRAVERALARVDQEGPLERSLPELPELHDATDEGHLRPGAHLGPWRMEAPLGEGGMARVYLAERAIGPAQKVAIKLIRRELISPRLRERFLREQQVVARLEHPGIARMIDTGMSEEGEPWLATEYVAGKSLLHWCADHQLDLPARLRLFLRLLGAVQHAHQHLVVHRDIKPSNILVTGDGQPKLLDFGIALALDENTPGCATRTELRVLTPDYAAPEQFTGDPISTATDLYALGVVLYELLTGVRPRRPSARDGSVSITAPSQALATPGSPVLASPRRGLRAQLRGDLDAIVLKALRESPADRYSSAEAMALDLQAYLDGRPVHARRGDRWYRLRKFAGRNRYAVAFGGLAFIALAGGVVATLWQASIAREQAARAQAAAEESRAQLDYLGSLLDVLAPSTADARELDRARLIAEATRRARGELASRPHLLASVELSLGGVAEKVGAYEQAADLFDHAYRRRVARFGRDSVEAAQALIESGAIRQNLAPPQPQEAEKRLREAMDILRARAPRGEPMVRALEALAVTIGDQDEYPEAQALLAEAARLCAARDIAREYCERVWLVQGSVYARLRQGPETIRAYEQAYASRRARLGEGHADTVFVAAYLGRRYFDNGHRARGLAMLEAAYERQKQIYAAPTQSTLDVIEHLATMLVMDDQIGRALPLRLEHLQRVRNVFGDSHPDVALSHANLGSLYYAEGRFAEAVGQQRRAHEIYSAYAGSDGMATLLVEANLADALLQGGRAREALPLARHSATEIEKQFGADSSHLAAKLSVLGRTQAALGLTEAALGNLDRSIALYRKLHPQKPVADSVAAMRAKVLLMAGHAAEAESVLRGAVARIDASQDRTQRAYWEAYAYLVEAACAHRARDCQQLRATARTALAGQAMPGIAKQRIEAALAATTSG